MKCCTPSGLEGQEQQKDETNKEIVKSVVVDKQKPRMAGEVFQDRPDVMPPESSSSEPVLTQQVMPQGWQPPQRGTSYNNRGPIRPIPAGMEGNVTPIKKQIDDTQSNKRDYKAEFRMMLQQQSLDRLRNNPRYGTKI